MGLGILGSLLCFCLCFPLFAHLLILRLTFYILSHYLLGDPLDIGLCVLVNFDRRRVEHDSFLTSAAAILAPVAPPPVLADAAAAALLAPAAPPPVLAEAAAAAVLALAALPTVLTKAATAALLAPAAPPPVLAGAAAAAVLAIVAMPPVRADAAAAALLALEMRLRAQTSWKE